MEKFIEHTGVAAPILRINVDTDAIIPSREMKRVSKEGLSEGLFAGWRYTEPGGRELTPDFVLNQPAYKGVSIILSGDNFGCGSSREHAVWALAEYGIRAVIAPSFGAIFYNNCVRNGIVPIILDDDVVKVLATQVEANPQASKIHIDLPNGEVTAPDGATYAFQLEPANKHMLLEGLDMIDMTLQHKDAILNFQKQDRAQRSWVYVGD
jgi:3-isopropylmalate/(R)-2-methylmalate dehydratase small subunit